MKKSLAIVIISLACVSWYPGAAPAAADLEVIVQPQTIQIGGNYNGTQITVSGEAPSNADILIRVKGETENYKLKKKGRALGVLWMNLASVDISNVPNLFLLFLPENSVNTGRKGAAAWQELGLGLDGIRKKAKIVSEDDAYDGLFAEFVKLKQKSGLYGTTNNAVHYTSGKGAMKSFEATLALPTALPQGTFNIEVFAVNNGAIEASAVRTIEASEVGMPAWIAKMAFHHGTLYGVLAVMAAILAGLLTGVLFKGEKGAH